MRGLRRLGLALGVAAGLFAPVAGAEALWLPPGFGLNNPDLAVAVGDSITLGVQEDSCANPDCVVDRPYPAALQGLLAGRYPGFVVVNAGRGGETTDGGLARLGAVLDAFRPGFVLIMEGTNDATFGRDPALTAANLQAMVQLAKANSTIPILGAIVPNFRDDPEAQSRIDAVNAMLPSIAAAEDVLFVDTFAAMNDPALFGSDDILHPNQQGYDILGAAWHPALSFAIDVSQAIRPQLAIDTPVAGAVLVQPFVVRGWAIDLAAPTGPGVDAVHIHAFPASGGPPVFLGIASYGAARPDIGAAFGAQFTNSGYELTASGLAPGTYDLVVFARSTATGTFNNARSVRASVSPPLMAVDAPPPGAHVFQPFVIGGWAVDLAAASGPGVDAVHVYAFPASGGAPIFLGVAGYGAARPDIGAAFGAQFTNSGFAITVAGLSPGAYQLVVFAHSTVTGTFDAAGSVAVGVR